MSDYPKTMTAPNGHEVTIHSYGPGWHNGQRCYIVAFQGEPEDFFGSKAHADSVGVEYPTILNVGEFRGLTVVHFLPDTTHFPQYAAELDRLGDWPKP